MKPGRVRVASCLMRAAMSSCSGMMGTAPVLSLSTWDWVGTPSPYLNPKVSLTKGLERKQLELRAKVSLIKGLDLKYAGTNGLDGRY